LLLSYWNAKGSTTPLPPLSLAKGKGSSSAPLAVYEKIYRALAEKFSVGPTEKIPKNSKKDRKVALLSLFQGGGATEKRPIIAK